MMNAEDITAMFEGICTPYKEILCREDREGFSTLIASIQPPITPEPAKVFEAFRQCPYDQTRVIIIGQDPYPEGATGMAFDVGNGDIPGSLKNIGKAIVNSGFTFESGNLSSWAKQGVLLLNTALTTQPGKSGVHTKEWAGWTTRVITSICKRKASEGKPLVIIMWGDAAGKYQKIIDKINFESINTQKPPHKYAMWSHPSPASTLNNGDPTDNRKHFANTDNFRKTNQWLEEFGTPSINWSTTS